MFEVKVKDNKISFNEATIYGIYLIKHEKEDEASIVLIHNDRNQTPLYFDSLPVAEYTYREICEAVERAQPNRKWNNRMTGAINQNLSSIHDPIVQIPV